jgi:hypothetical protein
MQTNPLPAGKKRRSLRVKSEGATASKAETKRKNMKGNPRVS